MFDSFLFHPNHFWLKGFCCRFCICVCFFKIYLFEIQGYKETERKREIFIFWFISQMVATARAGLGPSQEPGTLFRSPIWMSGVQALKQTAIAPSGSLSRSWFGSGEVRTKTSTHVGCWHGAQWLKLGTTISALQIWILRECLNTTCLSVLFLSLQVFRKRTEGWNQRDRESPLSTAKDILLYG